MGRPRKNNSNFLGIFRPIFTVVILSAFVLGISFLVKTIATSDSKVLLGAINPLLSKFNIDSNRVQAVAGAFATRVSQTGIAAESENVSAQNKESVSKDTTTPTKKKPVFKVALMSDSHDENANLTSALKLAKAQNPLAVIHLGDFTNYGETSTLGSAKAVMDAGELDYYTLPGDHDLYKSVGPQNFVDVFGADRFSKTINGVKFVGLNNSANYTVIDSAVISWFKTELKEADFVLLSQPLYHPNLDVVMGVVKGQTNASVKAQAEELLSLIRDSGVKAIIAGDQHMSSQHKDPKRASLSHIVVGTLSKEAPPAWQSPRFSILSYFEDSSYQVEDVLLK